MIIHDVAILDRQPVVLNGLREFFSRATGFRVLYQCTDERQLLEAARDSSVSVVVVDPLQGEGWTAGSAFLRSIRLLAPEVRIVAFSSVNSGGVVSRAITSGANAYVSKQDDLGELLIASAKAANHAAPYFSRKIKEAMRNIPGSESTTEMRLTPRELEVVRCYAAGMRLSRIASEMGLSTSTVSAHKKSAMNRIGASSNVELILYAQMFLSR